MTEINKNYSPDEIENRWYQTWEEQGLFKPDPSAVESPFCIVIPPPNVTGSLHMGHALNAVIQDILTRWKKMLGHKVLWLPGMDHAGIATQNVVERALANDGIDRHRLGRDAFVDKVWAWKAEYGGKIIHQLKKLGASCDWSRQRFTLDEGLSIAVREVFVRLFDEGLIYRDNRLINWCPRCHTALSDLEVEYEELDGRLYFIRYPVSSGHDHVVVATTRPETMLGDTAVAVHPEDDRYAYLIGKSIELPLTGRKIHIIADPAVDPAFGTGAVKVTPAHDFNDEAMGKRNNLESISVIGEDGRMSVEAGPRFKGLDRYECRKSVLHNLEEQGLLEEERKHRHSVGHCYRCKTIIEPLLTIQWYVKIGPLAKEAIKVVEDGRIRLVPDGWTNNYNAWMKDIKDWCISRQIWWGHRIPVWYCPSCRSDNGSLQGEMIEHIFFEPVKISNLTATLQKGGDGGFVTGGTYSGLRNKGLSHEEIISNSKIIRVSRGVKNMCSREDLKQCPVCGGGDIIRDPDVLDTWFSSALWPFSTLGWPDNTEDLKAFYPTSVLVTGFDILFFWVARMIMMGVKFMDDVPFRDVYIHALVRDAKGQKMSKSKGNVIDPLLMIDKFGADAFRFSLAAFAAQGRDVRFSEERVEGYRHFINKLWNASRFITTNSEGIHIRKVDITDEDLDLGGRWILSRLAYTADEVNRHLHSYRFNDAAGSIYQFIWHEFCDWYIEFSKYAIYEGSAEDKERTISCLLHVLEICLKLLHPFTPFVTDELYHVVFGATESIMLEDFPKGLKRSSEAEQRMSYVIDAVTAMRSIKGELNISPSMEIQAYIKTDSMDVAEVLRLNQPAFMKLARCREINIGKDIKKPKGSAVAVKDRMEIYIPIEGLLDIKAEIARIGKEKDKIDKDMIFLNRKLLNEDFLKNAPEEIVDKEKTKLEALLLKKAKLDENVELLKALES
jgi:valyl-tRNA synthetase